MTKPMTATEYKAAFDKSIYDLNKDVPSKINRATQRVKDGDINCVDAFFRLTSAVSGTTLPGDKLHVVGTTWGQEMYEALESFGKVCLIGGDKNRWNWDAPLKGARPGRPRRRR